MSPTKKPASAPKPARPTKRTVAVKQAGAIVAVPPIRMGPADYERARHALMAQEPRLGALIEKIGPCRLPFRKDGDLFSALCETITSQQLSTRVADVIYGRLCAACAPEPHPTPARMLALDTAALRAAGLSGPKAAYVHALAERVGHGDLSLEALDTMPDDEVIAVLSSIKGIGRWSAQMILLFRLHRPDVWPIGDLGIVRGVERLHNLRTPPTPKRMEQLGEKWRPYRSVAAWYLWAGAKE
ncbi:MAG: DNA-3-methyladenine glycosylase [Vicinamibacteraceae bacterium]